ncbi:MAG: non-homologous end-joining DNA ligase [Planctomycetota bacterium]
MGKSIRDYRDKRDFARTPEPEPGPPGEREARSVFVVHRHEARSLHYDLRLEMEGVLESWAVPKGFSWLAGEKRLAVRTEDHPVEYEDFEGVIPRGQYGAGTMKIWDRGTYELLAGTSLDAGELKLALRGRRLRGEWHLVKTRGRKDHWLLFKARDRYARREGESVPNVDLSRVPEAPFPRRVRLMRPRDSAEPFSDPDWVFEMRFDGRRVRAIRELSETKDEVRLVAGRNLAPRLPGLVHDLGMIRAERAVLDGVLVALDRGGRPSRETLEQRLRAGPTEGVLLYVFDLCYFEDWDLRRLPLLDRKAILASILPRSSRLFYVDHVAGNGEELGLAAAAGGLEGLIAKRVDSAYVGGESDAWRQIRVEPSQSARQESFEDALLAGVPGRSGARGTERARPSNPAKVYWPREGHTKGELFAYYAELAEFLLPYLSERPVHMLRCPDGIDGKSFYQRQAPAHVPDWIQTLEVSASGEEHRHVLCNDRDTLLYLVNLGSIDLHPWLSRRGSLDSPDWAVLDLDPKSASFDAVIKVARALGKLLRGIGLRPCLKTSGKTGLHIYVPLRPGYSYEQSRMFTESVARIAVREHPDIATVERAMSGRGGRVYVDFLQNRRGQTVVPPYVVRPVEGATVSMPLAWDELDRELCPSRFTIATAPARVSRLGDLFRDALSDRQDLMPAIERLTAYVKG